MLLEVENADATYSPNSVGPFAYETIVSYVCNEFYEFGPAGNSERECSLTDGTTTGDWTGSAPSCIRKREVNLVLF